MLFDLCAPAGQDAGQPEPLAATGKRPGCPRQPQRLPCRPARRGRPGTAEPMTPNLTIVGAVEPAGLPVAIVEVGACLDVHAEPCGFLEGPRTAQMDSPVGGRA